MVWLFFRLWGRNADCIKALPHDEVETTEFYKHIESEGLSEPRRMKQLLTWCGTRALGEKPSFSGKDRDAALAGMLAVLHGSRLQIDASLQHARSSPSYSKTSPRNQVCQIGSAEYVFPPEMLLLSSNANNSHRRTSQSRLHHQSRTQRTQQTKQKSTN